MTALGDNGPTVVVGGGIAGAYMAARLGRAGQQVTVLDSRPDPRTADGVLGRSINLALAERGLAALRELDLVDIITQLCVPMQGRIIHDEHVSGLQPYGIHPDEILLSVDRTALTNALLDAAEATGNVEVRFGQRCRDIDFDLNLVSLSDADEDDAWYQIPFGTVIGADGVASVVRSSMIDANNGSVRREMLDHGYLEIEVPAGPNGEFLMEREGLHIWPHDDFMMIALPNPGGDFTATLFLANESDDGPSFAALTSAEQISVFFETYFADLAALVPDHVEQFLDAPVGRLGTIRTQGWSFEDRAVLIGDSAHGIVPFHGQGMNAALETAAALSRLIDETPTDLVAVFDAFEIERRDNANAIADMALENYVEMRDKVNDPDYILKRQLSLELTKRLPDYWRPRYNMVMFSAIPYADAFARGKQQQALLAEFVAGCSTLADVDIAAAEARVRELGPLPT